MLWTKQWVVAMSAALGLFASVEWAPAGTTGNGAPSGAHFNLNLISVSKGKTADMTGGNRIFVTSGATCKINLSEGSFAVLDGNGTDGTAAFQLPNPDPDNDGYTSYSAYVRGLGKPTAGQAKITPGAVDVDGPDNILGTEDDYYTMMSTESVTVTRTKGKSSFTNVSRELLYVWVDIDGDGRIDRIPLFDDRLQDYFWQYDNNGLKVVQLRFYEISSGPYNP